jgi:dCMP deaminase
MIADYKDENDEKDEKDLVDLEDRAHREEYEVQSLLRSFPDRERSAFHEVVPGTESVPIEVLDEEKRAHFLERERPRFEQIYIQLAFQLARRSTCARLNVGTVVTSTDFRKVLSVGYNGNASGLPNVCDRSEPGNCGCLHSEENAVINCDAPRAMEKYVFVTHLPCVMCAKRLINLGGVQKVFYAIDYRSHDSIKLFESVGIEVHRLVRES